MTGQLKVSLGQRSDKGRKESNQDFYGARVPEEPLLSAKGIAIALADGISSSDVSHVASEAAVTSFLQDYYCTSEAWSVKTSVQRVMLAANSWLYSQTRQSQHCYDKDRGYVCTFSALVIKSTTAHIFHVGDARIYRLRDKDLEQLTEDHRIWTSQEKSYLSRALGISRQTEIDYQSLAINEGDIFLLLTDGVYEHVSADAMVSAVRAHENDLDLAAKVILAEAYTRGSKDNLTIQIVSVDQLTAQSSEEVFQQLTQKPFPPALEARMRFDGYEIIREVHASSRSHVYLAVDTETGIKVIIKTPSTDLRRDPAYLERFLMEDWVARRVNSSHVLKPCPHTRKRHYLYVVTEYIDGQTLAQWMLDNPKPDVEMVRNIVEQIARGLRAFHRLEMLHQDMRPENIMIDREGTVKIIDFGSTRVAGLLEVSSPIARYDILGTLPYTAPEYFVGEGGSTRSDLFSLGVITYQMLSGKLPYGTHVPKARTKAAQRKLNYLSVLDDEREIPAWMDDAIRKAVHPNPLKRYDELSEFIFDLRQPNAAFLSKTRPPLIERNPLLFWKGLSLILAVIIVILVSNMHAVE
jgi:serine/threonine protein phosphatase PrpC